METKGVIENIDKKNLTIKLYKNSHCTQCDHCGERTKFLSKCEITTDIPANVGDLITLRIDEKKLLKIAAIGYMFPVISMMLGYFFFYKLGYSEGICIAGSFGFLVLSFFIIFIIDRRFAKKSYSHEIKVVSIEHPEEERIDYTSCESFEA